MAKPFEQLRRLILPATVLRQEPVELSAQFFTYEQITNEKCTAADFIQALSALKRSDVLRWASAMIELVSGPGAHDLGISEEVDQ